MGVNILQYIDMQGRVIIDLLKYVQREYKLNSYKLDFVSENFMNGKVPQHDKNRFFKKNVFFYVFGFFNVLFFS